MSWKKRQEKLRERAFKASGATSLDAFDKQVTRAAKGVTTEEALFLIASKYGVQFSREFEKLPPYSQQRVSSRIVQNNVEVNTTRNVKIDKRTVNLHGSMIQNLTIGDRSVVTQSAELLSGELERLFGAIENSQRLNEEEKADYKSDLEALASQIGKKQPNKGIVRAAWNSIEKLATVDGFVGLVSKVTPLVTAILS